MMLRIIESSLIAITITNTTNTEYSSFYYDIYYSDEVYLAIIVENTYKEHTLVYNFLMCLHYSCEQQQIY